MLYSQIKNIRKKTNFSFKKTGKRHKKDGSYLAIKKSKIMDAPVLSPGFADESIK